MKIQLKADLMLLLVTFFWGASILLTKLGLDGIEEYNLIALRFIIAFLLPLSARRLHLICFTGETQQFR